MTELAIKCSIYSIHAPVVVYVQVFGLHTMYQSKMNHSDLKLIKVDKNIHTPTRPPQFAPWHQALCRNRFQSPNTDMLCLNQLATAQDFINIHKMLWVL